MNNSHSLTFIFSGTCQRYQDPSSYLGFTTPKRHNIEEIDDLTKQPHYFVIYDGVAQPPGSKNPDTLKLKATLSKSKSNKWSLDFSSDNDTFGFHNIRAFLGNGMEDIANTAKTVTQALQTEIKKANAGHHINNITLIGHSRGGITAIKTAQKIQALIKAKKLPQETTMTLALIDPVEGFMADGNTPTTKIPKNVSKLILGLSLGETRAGFFPQVIGFEGYKRNLSFESKNTRFLSLPLPDTHPMAPIWMASIIKAILPLEHPLYHSKIDLKQPLSPRSTADKIRLTTRLNEKLYHETNRFKTPEKQLEHYMKHIKPSRCRLELFNYFKSLPQLKNFEPQTVMPHTPGLGVPLIRALGAFFSPRYVKTDIKKFTRTPFFLNLYHEALFQRTYPNLYGILTGSECSDKVILTIDKNERVGLYMLLIAKGNISKPELFEMSPGKTKVKDSLENLANKNFSSPSLLKEKVKFLHKKLAPLSEKNLPTSNITRIEDVLKMLSHPSVTTSPIATSSTTTSP